MILRALFTRNEQRQLSLPASTSGSYLLSDLAVSNTGVVVTPDTALRVAAVFACIRLIASTIGTLPIHVYRKRGSGAREQVDDHPAAGVLTQRPNPSWTRQQLIEQLVTHLLLWGNAFLGVRRNDLGYPLEIWLIHPARVRVWGDGHTRKYLVDEQPVASSEIVHIPALSIDPMTGIGLSPIAAAREAIGIALAADEAAARFWEAGGIVSGIIKTDASLTPEQAQRLLQAWESMHRGTRKAGRVAVLDSGADWQPVSAPWRDFQFLEQRQFQIAEIARLFGVPPHLIGDVDRSTSWGTGIAHQTLGFLQFTLRPWLVRLEDVFTQDLIITRGLYVQFSVEGLLRADIETRFQAYRMGREIGIYTANEIRELEDLPPVGPEGDILYAPANWLAVTRVPSADQQASQQQGPAQPAAQ